MALTDRIDIFTQAMNSAFINAYEIVPEQAPVEDAIFEVPSKGRVENYPWMYPPPILHQWKGYRQYAKLGETSYRVPNITYTAEFEILKEDFDDDQVGGFKLQAAGMAEGAREWRIIQSLQNLAVGQTTPCFDGSNFFAANHTVGTGNNVVSATTTGSDGVTHAMVFLFKRRAVKPMLWQLREGPEFHTDMGSKEAEKARSYKWWCNLRGAAAFGFWFDAVLCKFPNTPTVADVQTALGVINSRFRQFTYPKNLPTDVNYYPHGQTVFNQKSALIICSSLIEHIVRQALTLSLIGATENFYKGFADLACSGYLDGVV
jgi:phage major head subunit gpT-like protein